MPHYFFDTRSDSHLVRDESGQHLDGMDAVRNEAARGLADLAHDAIPRASRGELAVEVRDEADQAVLTAALRFEVAVVAAKIDWIETGSARG
ncbi:MAG: hypothetical protein JOZ16_00605 [Methylobacteriaceae bacterium]|nr:hypothetical protein [Methylobacteriaceae bacterium]